MCVSFLYAHHKLINYDYKPSFIPNTQNNKPKSHNLYSSQESKKKPQVSWLINVRNSQTSHGLMGHSLDARVVCMASSLVVAAHITNTYIASLVTLLAYMTLTLAGLCRGDDSNCKHASSLLVCV